MNVGSDIFVCKILLITTDIQLLNIKKFQFLYHAQIVIKQIHARMSNVFFYNYAQSIVRNILTKEQERFNNPRRRAFA